MTKTLKSLILLTIIPVLAALAACGGTPELSCDEVQSYQLAVEGKRIETPEDLDGLNELREMPLPEASPRPPRPEGSPCLDLPPSILSGGT
jgi:hypothetical protein